MQGYKAGEAAAIKAVTNLRQDTMDRVKNKLAKVAAALQQAENIDYLILLDITGSMGEYLEEARRFVDEAVSEMRERLPQVKLRLAFIGYRDWETSLTAKCAEPTGSPRLVVKDFTNNGADFKDFLNAKHQDGKYIIRAAGGADSAEDIAGALQKATTLSWGPKGTTKIILHILDAPCHGKAYHDTDDSFPDGDPTGLKIKDLLDNLHEKGLTSYYMMHVHYGATNKMARQWMKECRSLISTMIEVTDFKPEKLLDSFIDSTIASFTFSTTMASAGVSGGPPPDFKEFEFSKDEPLWNTIPIMKVEVGSFEYPESVDELVAAIQNGGSLGFTKTVRKVQIAPKPFSQGGVRVAYKALMHFNAGSSASSSSPVKKNSKKGRSPSPYDDGTIDSEPVRWVVKEPRDKNSDSLANYLADCETHTVAAYLATQFTKALQKCHIDEKLKYGKGRVLFIKNKDSDEVTYRSAEPYLDGDYNKYMTTVHSLETVKKESQAVQAFSHWTFQKTKGFLVVVDVQGVKCEDKYMMTDPAVHCLKFQPKFGTTNLSHEGMKLFFRNHKCNDICKKLGLPVVNPETDIRDPIL